MKKNHFESLNKYKIMWVMIFFDLPTSTATERKTASRFRKQIMENGFTMFQFSIYMRHCPSSKNAEVHIKRVKKILPKYGHISILTITDYQFGKMENYRNLDIAKMPNVPRQLELF